MDFFGAPIAQQTNTASIPKQLSSQCKYFAQGRCMFGASCHYAHGASPLPESANYANPSATLTERIAFYHAAMFSPAIKTWCDAIDAGRMTTCPELTSTQVRRHPPNSSKLMIMGHLDQNRKNKRSNKVTPPDVPTAQPADPTASTALPNTAEQDETPTDVCPPQTDPPALKSLNMWANSFGTEARQALT